MLTADTLIEKFNVDEPATAPKDAKPLDIKEYQETIAKVTTLVESTNRLVGTVGMDKLLPQLVKAIDEAENESRNLVNHSFRQAGL
jgi:hypothetical protein